MILKNCTFFNENFEKEYGDIKIKNGKIEQIGIFADNESDTVRDMSGKIVLPGMIDIHIHAGGGGDFCDASDEAVNTVSRYLAKHGVTGYCATTMTLGADRLTEIVKNLENHADEKGCAKMLGINLEGPYISRLKCGAQNSDFIREGSKEEFDRLYSLGNKIKLITVAPEAFDSDDFIGYVSKKCVVSIGHTAANEQQCRKALENGASHATHLYNAMTPMTHREAGCVGVLMDSGATCELICDTHHICPTVLRNTFKILGSERICVISDSMRAAGLGSGSFEFGGQTVFVANGDNVARLEDGTIAASVTNVFDEFKNLVAMGIDFADALRACTITPARVIGAQDSVGSIARGKFADLVAVDENLEISEVYINGIQS